MDGWLGGGGAGMGWVDVGFTLANDVWPVVGVREGKIGRGCMSTGFTLIIWHELMGIADMEDFELWIVEGVRVGCIGGCVCSVILFFCIACILMLAGSFLCSSPSFLISHCIAIVEI